MTQERRLVVAMHAALRRGMGSSRSKGIGCGLLSGHPHGMLSCAMGSRSVLALDGKNVDLQVLPV